MNNEYPYMIITNADDIYEFCEELGNGLLLYYYHSEKRIISKDDLHKYRILKHSK